MRLLPTFLGKPPKQAVFCAKVRFLSVIDHIITVDGDVKRRPCLGAIGDKWKVLILRNLIDGTKRFGELKKSIGTVSQKVLTAQLGDM